MYLRLLIRVRLLLHLTDAQITNSQRAEKGEFPYTVQVQDCKPVHEITGSITNICTGVTITANFVLTAAHCVN